MAKERNARCERTSEASTAPHRANEATRADRERPTEAVHRRRRAAVVKSSPTMASELRFTTCRTDRRQARECPALFLLHWGRNGRFGAGPCVANGDAGVCRPDRQYDLFARQEPAFRSIWRRAKSTDFMSACNVVPSAHPALIAFLDGVLHHLFLFFRAKWGEIKNGCC